MEVEYNDVLLQQTEIQSIQREAVYDDTHTDLLYVRWVIGVMGVYAPNGFPPATAARYLRRPRTRIPIRTMLNGLGNVWTKFRDFFIGVNAAPTPVNLRVPVELETVAADDPPPGIILGTDIEPEVAAGYGPILTDAALRNRLLTPRQKLRITGADWSDGTKVVTLIESPAIISAAESPPSSYATDPTNGPHPIALDIISGQDMSFAVFFQIETTVLPCEDLSDRLILSHRWQMSHTHDDNQYLTRVIDGEVVLNGSMINTFGLNPDLLRGQLFHPIPLGHYRSVPHVTPSADGLTYTYRISDHDESITFDAGDSGATSIDIAEKLAYYIPRLAKAVAG